MPSGTPSSTKIVANIGGCDSVATAEKRKSLRPKNASRTSQSYLWCNVAPQDGEPYSTPFTSQTPNIYVGLRYENVVIWMDRSWPEESEEIGGVVRKFEVS